MPSVLSLQLCLPGIHQAPLLGSLQTGGSVFLALTSEMLGAPGTLQARMGRRKLEDGVTRSGAAWLN